MISFKDIKPAELSRDELLSLIKKQQDEIGQKEKHIDHLLSNAQKWTKKLEQSQAQSSVPETKKEAEASEQVKQDMKMLGQENKQLKRQIKSAKAQYKKMLARVGKLEKENKRLQDRIDQTRPELDIENLAVFDDEQTTLMEFSKDAKSIFAKYSN